MYDTVAGSYNYLKLDTKAIAKKVAELLKNNHFTPNSLVSTLPFTIFN